jgi:hypothetical protein
MLHNHYQRIPVAIDAIAHMDIANLNQVIRIVGSLAAETLIDKCRQTYCDQCAGHDCLHGDIFNCKSSRPASSGYTGRCLFIPHPTWFPVARYYFKHYHLYARFGLGISKLLSSGSYKYPRSSEKATLNNATFHHVINKLLRQSKSGDELLRTPA